ncbi:MAG: hypothetical protein ACK4F6_19470, partial [Hylemonella sp.]
MAQPGGWQLLHVVAEVSTTDPVYGSVPVQQRKWRGLRHSGAGGFGGKGEEPVQGEQAQRRGHARVGLHVAQAAEQCPFVTCGRARGMRCSAGARCTDWRHRRG